MPDWPSGFSSPALIEAGSVLSTSKLTTITGSATPSTKGSWVALTTSLPDDAVGVYVTMMTDVATTMTFLVDIGVGASGEEKVRIPNLQIGAGSADFRDNIFTAYFPIHFRAGNRVSVRCQSSAASGTVTVGLHFAHSGFLRGTELDRVTAYGIVEEDSGGIQIDPGTTAHTKGAWSQIVASTANPIKQLAITINHLDDATRSDGDMMLDVAVGASGAEKIILGNLYFKQYSVSDMFEPAIFGPYKVSLPAGVRLAVRGQSSLITTDRLFEVALYGVD